MIERESRKTGSGALTDTTNANVGFVLSHEQFPVTDLVEFASRAEQAGFDCLSTSDHFQPWQANQGHVGFAWVTLGAVGQRTRKLPFGTAVTCPTYRYRPAIVAQAFASLALLYPGRVFLGVGTGEALNEVPAGGGWGSLKERSARLVEAVQLIRRLWTGETVDLKGQFYEVKYARIYDVPPTPVPIYIAAGGPKSARLAGEHGDGLITDSESALKPEIRQAFEEGARAAGKDPSTMPILAEMFVCAGTESEARPGAEKWRFQPKAFTEYVDDPDPVDIMERARQEIGLEDVLKKMTVAPDPETHIKKVQETLDGGVSSLLVHSVQEDQLGFIDFYGKNVLPKIERRSKVTAGE